MQRRHSDELFEFSYRLFKIEYVIIKLVFLALSLFGLYKFAEQEFGFKLSATPAHAQENHDPCRTILPVFRSD